MTAPIVLRVTGDPAPKGSSRAMLRGGRAVNVPSGSGANAQKLKGWASAVTDAWGARKQAAQNGDVMMFTAGPLAVGLVFRFPLRKTDLDKLGGPKDRAPLVHVTTPDVDKLVRSTLDALTSAGAWHDDAQVAVCLAAKLYVPPGARLGADVTIGAIDALYLTDAPDVLEVWRDLTADVNATMANARQLALEARVKDRQRPTVTRGVLR